MCTTDTALTLIQDITAIVTEKDCLIKSLEEKIKELKVSQLQHNVIVLLECFLTLVHTGKESNRRIQCIPVAGTSYST